MTEVTEAYSTLCAGFGLLEYAAFKGGLMLCPS